jgi:hypothetical protein
MSTTIRIARTAHATLADLATDRGVTRMALLTELIERERRRQLFDAADESYRRLAADPKA